MPGTVIVERSGRIGIIRLNRPEKLNAVNMEMVGDLIAALDGLADDRGIGAVVITGSGKAFSAGADVAEMLSADVEELEEGGHLPLWRRLESFGKPVIAALNGITAGGGLELAMACDIALASTAAMIGQTEINLGIIPGAGGTQRLTRAVGKQKAMEMILTGRLISASEAEECGLVLKAVVPEALMDEAVRIAGAAASHPQFPLRLAKESVNQSFENHLRQGLEMERRNFLLSVSSPDGREGMKAFVGKRKPEWGR